MVTFCKMRTHLIGDKSALKSILGQEKSCSQKTSQAYFSTEIIHSLKHLIGCLLTEAFDLHLMELFPKTVLVKTQILIYFNLQNAGNLIRV